VDRRASQRERELASQLLGFEGCNPPDGGYCLDALARTLDKLHQTLNAVVGPAGSLVLAERALRLAVQECSVLERVRVTLQDDRLVLEGVTPGMAGYDEREVGEAAVALLGNVLWLTSTFVGADLTLRLIRSVWPAIG
jgi:hypothetical protein